MNIRIKQLSGVALLCAFQGQAAAVTWNNEGFEAVLGTTIPGWTQTLSGGSAEVVTSWLGIVGDGNNNQIAAGFNYQLGGGKFLVIGASTDNAHGTEWQSVSQKVIMAANEKLYFSAAFDWGDLGGSPYEDGAKVEILNAANAVIATPFDENGIGKPSFYDGPWVYWEWSAPSAGEYTLKFSARNTLDEGYPSYGLFDVTAVPEPETYALMLAGLGLVGFMAHRRKRAAA